ncbi:MAG: hypothetical protein L0G94_10130 [Brachybacterium sp.]|nr:hypothetical protein [Brachybacterium sp.]
MTAIYAVDDEGCPSDPIIRDAFRDATCAHATAWSALGVDPDAGVAGITSVSTPTGKSLGSASLNYSVTLVEAGVQAKVSTLFALTGQAASLIRGALPNARVRAVD